jgi:SAM-dependent methyltransferase
MEPVDYFANHGYKLRFPWTLYHGPLVEALRIEIARTPGLDLLNIGSGPFFELGRIPRDRRRYTICDIDERAVRLAKEQHGDRIVRADVVRAGEPLPYADASFDLVVSMEVVEHVLDPGPWVREALRVLRPSGKLFLTTPNYGSTSLVAIERTVLEAIARANGFSRKDLHPTKFDARRLRALLEGEGARTPEVRVLGLGWVLAVTAFKA